VQIERKLTDYRFFKVWLLKNCERC